MMRQGSLSRPVEEMVGDRLEAEYRAMDDRTGTGDDAMTVSVAEAARVLGVSHDAIRARLHRGALNGRKVDGLWRVELPVDTTGPIDPAPTVNRMRQDAPPAVDVAPLVDHIARLEEKVERLTEASTIWQIRARQAEERLLQLTAGEPAPTPTGEALPDSVQDISAPDPVSEPVSDPAGKSALDPIQNTVPDTLGSLWSDLQALDEDEPETGIRGWWRRLIGG